MIVLTQAKPHGSPLLQHANADICGTHVSCSSDHFLRNSPFPLVGSKCCFATRTSQGESKISCFIFVAEMLVHNTLFQFNEVFHRSLNPIVFFQFQLSIRISCKRADCAVILTPRPVGYVLCMYHRLATDFTQFSSSIELQHCASFYRVVYTTLISRTIEKEKPFQGNLKG